MEKFKNKKKKKKKLYPIVKCTSLVLYERECTLLILYERESGSNHPFLIVVIIELVKKKRGSQRQTTLVKKII